MVDVAALQRENAEQRKQIAQLIEQLAKLNERVAELPLEIESWSMEGLSIRPSPEFERLSTVIVVEGGGHEGRGEDITYEALDQIALQDAGPTQFAISLGLFKNEAAAARHLALLRDKGVRSAQVATRGSGTTRVEVRGPSDSLASLASDLSEHLRGVSRLECAP